MRDVIGAHIEQIHAALAVAPQTNEVGRSVALLAGLFDLVAASGLRRIRLLELGASAGLNLLLDEYLFRGHSWHFGPSDSKVQFADAIAGPVHPEPFEIVARAGCDLNPVDATTADGQLLLTSFVWPFDLDRHKRSGRRHRDRDITAGADRQGARQRVAAPSDGGGRTRDAHRGLAFDHPDVLVC